MPGYWRQPELSAASFDDEGFYRLGDAVRLAGVCEPVEGLIFDGRMAEDFKLSSGTWVSVGPLRARLLEALAPLVQDVVIAGLNREHVCALLFLDAAGCSMSIAGVAGSANPRELARNELLRSEIARRLAAFARAHPASSMRVQRALLMELAPSPAQGEITDKGSLNQRMVLRNREAAVDALYSETPAPEIIVVTQEVGVTMHCHLPGSRS
jgi:feruloyl-CoA synthase